MGFPGWWWLEVYIYNNIGMFSGNLIFAGRAMDED
jgi:hypothetical protein